MLQPKVIGTLTLEVSKGVFVDGFFDSLKALAKSQM